MSWFKITPKTDKELQDELRALVDRIVSCQFISVRNEERYEELLYEIYKRNLIPCVKLVPNKSK